MLEVGAGSGYQAAVSSEVASEAAAKPSAACASFRCDKDFVETDSGKIRIVVRLNEHSSRVVHAHHGETLRAALLRQDCSPYRGRFKKLNCGGMGVCGSCKVRVREEGELWERRSCQVRCFQDMEIEVQ